MGINPWSAVILFVGICLVIIGVKGSQDNFIAAITGRPYKDSKFK